MTIAMASLAFTAIGTAASFYGQMQGAKAAKARGDYEAAVARNNQTIAERYATDAVGRGKTAADERRAGARQVIGAQRASSAARGVEVGTGSALDLTTDTAGIGELDALTLRHNAEREAYGFRTQGLNFASSGELARLRGENEATALRGSAFSTALTGAGTVASKWYNFNQRGAPNPYPLGPGEY